MILHTTPISKGTGAGKKKQNKQHSQKEADFSFSEKQEIIEKKAFELFEKRGYSQGRDWDDWFTAEKLVQNEGKNTR